MGHVLMKRPSRDESGATIDLGKPPARHAKGARPKPEPRHALVRQPSAPRPRRNRPEHATVRLHLPSFRGREVRPRHLLIGAALLGAGVASVVGAGAAAHRVDAATPPGPRVAPTAMALP